MPNQLLERRREPWFHPAALLLLLLLGAGATLALGAGKAPTEAPAPASTLTLITTASNRGEVKDCGCQHDPRGGLARRQYAIDSLRKERGPILLLDAGDFSHPWVRQPGGINGFLLGAMGELGYDAITLGDIEVHRGAEYVASLLDSARVPVVLANVRFKASGKSVGKPYVVREVGGRRCAVTGLLAGDLLDAKEAAAQFTFEDPAAAAARVVPEMRREADLVIVLAHLDPDAAMALPQEVPGIDVLVLGHNPGTVPPTRVGKTITVRSGELGQYLGEVQLHFGPGGEIQDFTGDVPMLELGTIPESPTMAARVADLLHQLGMAP
jgi:2',3'-cyclic-nucleotide 2'-phosphodiesterase (5'-nucleotidase family)